MVLGVPPQVGMLHLGPTPGSGLDARQGLAEVPEARMERGGLGRRGSGPYMGQVPFNGTAARGLEVDEHRRSIDHEHIQVVG
jgi:hypothetical protein